MLNHRGVEFGDNVEKPDLVKLIATSEPATPSKPLLVAPTRPARATPGMGGPPGSFSALLADTMARRRSVEEQLAAMDANRDADPRGAGSVEATRARM